MSYACRKIKVNITTLKEILQTKKEFKPSSTTTTLLELDAFIVLMYDGSGQHEEMKGDDIELWTRNINLGTYNIGPELLQYNH